MPGKEKNKQSYIISVSLMAGCHRHIRISADALLFDLHSAILDAFEFEDDHAHAFFMDNKAWSDANAYFADMIEDASRFTTKVTLGELGLMVGKQFKYVFDFGDDWRFQCKVLKVFDEPSNDAVVVRSVGEAPEQYESDEFEEDEDDESDEEIDFPEVFGEDELKERYAQLHLPEDTVKLLHDYFAAFAHLYGIIPLRKALEIYNQQNDPISEELFFAFAEIVRHENHIYCIMGEDELFLDADPLAPVDREIIEESLLINVDDYVKAKDSQGDKPYYIPRKAALLKYAEDLYFEQPKEFIDLRDFLRDQMKCDNADGLADELQLTACMNETDMNYIMQDMARMGLKFQTMEQLNHFLSLYSQMANNTRMAVNRGHTPNEIHEMTPGDHIPRSIRLGPNISNALQSGEMDIGELRKGIWAMDFPNRELKASYLGELDRIEREKKPVKVGRNDPCPCGSGRKYKQCCGKSK